MPTALLVRHGRTAANASGVLAGWTPGVHLDEEGQRQVGALAQRVAAVRLAAVVSSPLERCLETAAALVGLDGPNGAQPPVRTDARLGECRYGEWTGRELRALVKDPLWKVVQQHPSAAVFPGSDGESLRTMQQRAVDAVRDWDAQVASEHGDAALWLAVSHGDVIKAVLADALGAHLDSFQRIVVQPCSVSVVQYTSTRPFVLRTNDTGGDLSTLATPHKRARGGRRRRAHIGDAAVGGGT